MGRSPTPRPTPGPTADGTARAPSWASRGLGRIEPAIGNDTAYLHIQPPGGAPTQILGLADSAIQVGRGAHCEVRLSGPNVAEVQCTLVPVEGAWQVRPMSANGRIALDGRPISKTVPLPPDAILEVGDHRLSLKLEAAATGQGSFAEPIAVVPHDVSTLPFASRGVPAGDGPDEAERIERWREGLIRRERWLKARQEESRWSRRWRAASDRLRNSEPRKPADPIAPDPIPIRPARSRPAPPRPAHEEEVRRARPEEISARLGSVSPVDPDPSDLDLDDDERAARLAWEDSTATDHPTASPPAVSSPVEAEPIARVLPDVSRSSESEESKALDDDANDSAASSSFPSSEAVTEGDAPAAKSREFRVAPAPIAPPDGPTPESLPIGPGHRDPATWPSARAIVAAHAASTDATCRVPAPQRSRPRPTPAVAPATVALPGYLAIPTAVVVGLLAIVAVGLASLWAADSRLAAPLADKILAGEPIPAVGLDAGPVPSPTWWGTSADALLLQAAAIGRLDADPVLRDRADDFLGLAANAAPAHPGVRQAYLRRAAEADDDRRADLPAPNPSRDVAGLAEAARLKARLGRSEAAVDLLLEALELASKSDPALAEPPTFDGDRGVRRDRLPLEDRAAPLIRDLLAEAGGGTPLSTVLERLPDRAAVLLAAFRPLHAEGKPEADALLDRLQRLEPESAPSGDRRALVLAGRAEAEAFRGRWREAEPDYRAAAAEAHSEVVRRSLYRNLASIYEHLNDPDKMRAARAASWGVGGSEAFDPGPSAPTPH